MKDFSFLLFSDLTVSPLAGLRVSIGPHAELSVAAPGPSLTHSSYLLVWSALNLGLIRGRTKLFGFEIFIFIKV